MPYKFEDIKKLILEWESPMVEFKSNVSDKIGQTIVAFANTYGGTIVLGVGPSKEMIGVSDPDTASRKLRDILERCNPRPNINQEFITNEGKTYIILEIEPRAYSETPCFFDNQCFIRSGTTNQALSGEELIDFLKTRVIFNFEEMKSKANLEDLSIKKLSEFLERRGTKANLTNEEDIKSVLFGIRAANYNSDFYLKNLAVMFFGKEPNKFISNLEVRIVRYAGKEPSLNFIKFDRRVNGTIPELIETVFSILTAEVGTRFILKNLERVTIPTYPPEVIRELLTNAVGHRDYSDSNDILVEIFDDRLQITNPGGLLKGQTINNFYKTPWHRNPLVYQFLHDMHYGEGLGLGVPLVIRLLREAGLPDPIFNNLGIAFRVTIYNQTSGETRYEAEKLNRRQEEFIAYLKQNKYAKLKDYEKLTDVSHVTAIKDVNKLMRQGVIKRIGKHRGAYYELENGI
jgi:ATP-dependent DNA helicase RecG